MKRDHSDFIGRATDSPPPAKPTQSPVKGVRIGVALPVLAESLSLSTRAVNQLAVTGVIVKLDRGEYDLVQSVKNYIEKMRKPEAGVKEKLIAAQLGLAEVKLSQAKGELVPADQVQAKWDSILRTLRSSFMGIPARVQEHLPHLTPHDVSTIDREIRDTLTEMGEDHGND